MICNMVSSCNLYPLLHTIQVILPCLQAPFPDPGKKEAWSKDVPVFPAKLDATESISHEQQATVLRKYLSHLKIHIKKPTHAWRVAGSKTVHAADVDDKVCSDSL